MVDSYKKMIEFRSQTKYKNIYRINYKKFKFASDEARQNNM